MPLSIHVRLPLTTDEHEALVKRAGDAPVAAYLRKLLGLPPRRAGRPKREPKAKQ